MLFALIFPQAQHASLTFPLNEMYGYQYSRLCDRLRSSAIIWKQLSLRSSAIYDLRSAIVSDRLRSYGNQPLNFKNLRCEMRAKKARKSEREIEKHLMKMRCCVTPCGQTDVLAHHKKKKKKKKKKNISCLFAYF